MLRYTGIRSRQLRALRLGDLDLDGGQADVLGKGTREHSVLLPPVLLPTLAEFLEQVRQGLRSPCCWSTLIRSSPRRSTASTTRRRAREVELVAPGAGVDGRYSAQVAYATELVPAGVDIYVVQRLPGYTNIGSALGYTHLVVDELRSAVANALGRLSTRPAASEERLPPGPSAVASFTGNGLALAP